MTDFLYNYVEDIYSQKGEDGINKKIFLDLNITDGVVLEIGAWDGFYLSNTAALWSISDNYKGILIESSNVLNKKDLESEYDNIECFVEAASDENTLENIIDKCKFDVTEDNFVLASIDIDGNDLEVAKSLGKYKPIILIVEPNGDYKEKTNPEGSTIEELVEFGFDFGYEFIGMSGFVNKDPGNLYFIRKDYKSHFKICEQEWEKRGILLTDGKPVL